MFCRPEKHVTDLVRHSMPQQGGEVNFTRFLKPFYPITKDHGVDPDLGVWQGISQRTREIVDRDAGSNDRDEIAAGIGLVVLAPSWRRARMEGVGFPRVGQNMPANCFYAGRAEDPCGILHGVFQCPGGNGRRVIEMDMQTICRDCAECRLRGENLL